VNCSFVLFGQLRSLPASYPRSRLAEYEAELRNPSGVSVAKPPPIVFDAVLQSTDCEMIIEIGNATGLKFDRFWRRSSQYCIILTAILGLQTYFLVKQMEATGTRAVRCSIVYVNSLGNLIPDCC
jgi:hypothetical protein